MYAHYVWLPSSKAPISPKKFAITTGLTTIQVTCANNIDRTCKRNQWGCIYLPGGQKPLNTINQSKTSSQAKNKITQLGAPNGPCFHLGNSI